MHVDGFRFDLGSIMTRAHSTWQPAELSPDGELGAPLSGGAATDAHGMRSDSELILLDLGLVLGSAQHNVNAQTVQVLRPQNSPQLQRLWLRA